MNVYVALFVGVLATGTTYLILQQRLEAIKGGFLGAGLWLVFAYGMSNLEFVADNGTVVSDPQPSLIYLGLIMAGISIVIGLVGVGPFINVYENPPGETGGPPDEYR